MTKSTPTPFAMVRDWRDAILALMSDRTIWPSPADVRLRNRDWSRIEAIAQLHRLGPLLHGNGGASGVLDLAPIALRRRWAADFLQAKRRSYALARQIADLDEAIRAIGVDYALLKGPQLAWSCYPDAALRPMRDLDLLVARADAPRLRQALLACAYVRSSENEEPIDLSAKHLPSIKSASGGVAIEIHDSVISPMWTAARQALDTDQLLERRVTFQIGDRAYPALAPTDALLHFVVHCAHEHYFNSGPLVLSDIAYLLRRHDIDWPSFWEQAAHAEATAASAALLALTDLTFGGEIAPRERRSESVSPQVIESVKRGLLRDWTEYFASVMSSEMAEMSTLSSLFAVARRRFRAFNTRKVSDRLGVDRSAGQDSRMAHVQSARTFAALLYYAVVQTPTDRHLRRLVAHRPSQARDDVPSD